METTPLDQPAELVQAFADGWRIGAAQPQRFFEHFDRHLTPDAILSQPLAQGMRWLDRLSAVAAGGHSDAERAAQIQVLEPREQVRSHKIVQVIAV